MHVERKKSINKISATSDPAQWQLLCSILFPPAWWNMHVCPGELSPKHSLLLRWKTGLISVLNIWIPLPRSTLGSRSDRVAHSSKKPCRSSLELHGLKVQQCRDKDLLQFKQEWASVLRDCCAASSYSFFLFFANSGCLLWIKRLWKFTLSALPGCSLPSQAWMIQIRLQNCFKTEP